MDDRAICEVTGLSLDDLSSLRDLTAVIDQTNHKKNFESVASQRFQNFSWFGFERKALQSVNFCNYGEAIIVKNCKSLLKISRDL
jgi:hypothetical protein